MIKYIFKQIWVERRQNSWIVLELTLVFFFLLLMTDFLWVKIKNYSEPTGFDIENTFLLTLKTLEPIAPKYVNPEQNTQTPIEDLYNLVERIRQYPDVEAVSVSLYSSPYSMGGYWNSLWMDSTSASGLRGRLVTPSYFDVFRIRTADGQPISAELTTHDQIILTKDVAELFFGNAQQAVGKEVFIDDGPNADKYIYQVISVSSLFKRQEFYPYEGAFFEIISPSKLEKWTANAGGITSVDVCVRVRPGSKEHFQNNFETEMGERLKENNLYVATVVPSEKLRDNTVGKILREDVLPMTYVMVFVLITVFMGIFGTFWLRTRQRRSEIGIRMAMGADRVKIRSYMVQESLCLMLISIPLSFIVYLNMLRAEILETWLLPVSAERILIALFGAIIALIIIIIGGTLWPANRAASIQPIDALRDE